MSMFHDDPFVIADTTFTSRLITGTGGAPSLDVLEEALITSETELTTVAMRHVSPSQEGSEWEVLQRNKIRALPNTAGCFTATDAVRTAPLGRAAPRPSRRTLQGTAQHRRLLPRHRRRTHRPPGPGGAGDVLGQAGGDRRRAHTASRSRGTSGRGRTPRRRGVHRTAVHQRRSCVGTSPGTGRLCR